MSGDLVAEIRAALDQALADADACFAAGQQPAGRTSEHLRMALDELHLKAQAASGAFTNIVTSLAIKAAMSRADIRYHQTQIQHLTKRPAGVNFRGISEEIVYPWLDRNRFQGAKSGWQVRTLERPKPYLLTYDENIAQVKKPFLTVYDRIEEHGEAGLDALRYLIWKQVARREDVRITLSIPKTQDIALSVDLFRRHFFRSYQGAKGASRLPVLALHALYSTVAPQLRRYDGFSVLPLNEHSAADSQTGSLGDIEIADDRTGEIFEAIEVKHNLPITEAIAADVQSKVMDKAISRYYILTTHANCEPDPGARKVLENIKAIYDCQVIANGVLPTIRYYMRLLEDPSAIFPAYVALLQVDKAIAHEHRTAWNDVVKAVG